MRVRCLLATLGLTLGGLAGAAGYTVQTGDTLYNVARRSGSTVESLMALNRLSSSTLQLGQTLTLPGGLTALPPVGTVDQAVDSTALLTTPGLYRRLRPLYLGD